MIARFFTYEAIMKSALKVAVFAVGLSTFAATTAQAQIGPYAGAMVSRAEINHTDLTSLGYKLGFQPSQNLAVEARLGTGLTDDSISGLTYEIDNYVGVYGKLLLPLGPQFSAYVIGGYSRAEGKIYNRTSPVHVWSDHDFSAGLGLDLYLSQNVSASMEWINLVDEIDLLSFGVSFTF